MRFTAHKQLQFEPANHTIVVIAITIILISVMLALVVLSVTIALAFGKKSCEMAMFVFGGEW